MDDLIRRKDAIDLWDKYHYRIATEAIAYDRELRALPSAQPERCEDCVNFSKTRLLIPQPEIIRCKDCRFYNDAKGYCERKNVVANETIYYFDPIITDANDFCSKGKRRSE